MPSVMWRHAARHKFKEVSEDPPAILKMEAVNSFETMVNFYQSKGRYIPEEGNIQGRKYKRNVNKGKALSQFGFIRLPRKSQDLRNNWDNARIM